MALRASCAWQTTTQKHGFSAERHMPAHPRRSTATPTRRRSSTRSWAQQVGLYKIFVYSKLLRTNQPSVHSPRPPALPTLVEYYCTIIRQYTTHLPTSRLHAIHHTVLVITISCKGQATGRSWAAHDNTLINTQSSGDLCD